MSEDSGGVALVTVGQYGACPLCHDAPGPVTHACPWHLDQAACSYHAGLLVCQRCGGELSSIGARLVPPHNAGRRVDVRMHDAYVTPKPKPLAAPQKQRGVKHKQKRGKKRGR